MVFVSLHYTKVQKYKYPVLCILLSYYTKLSRCMDVCAHVCVRASVHVTMCVCVVAVVHSVALT